MSSPQTAPVFSVVVPVYNEGGHLKASFAEIRRHAASCGLPFEVILVDDGSADATWEVIEELAGAHGEVRGVRLSRNFGKEGAMSAGLDRVRGEAAVVMDGDLQHPPACVPEMVRLWREEGFQVVHGVKRRRGAEPRWRRWGAGLFARLMASSGVEGMQHASDFKLLTREVIDAWKRMGETQVFYRGMVAWLGFRRVELPFDVGTRPHGESAWSSLRLAALAVTALLSFSAAPLRIVSILGVLFLGAALLQTAWTLYMYFSGQAVTGFATVIILQLVTGSIVMVSLGVIGEYIANIYLEVKGRPRYVAANDIGAGARRDD